MAWGLTFSLLGVGAIAAGIGPARPPQAGVGLPIFGLAFGGFMILMGIGGFAGCDPGRPRLERHAHRGPAVPDDPGHGWDRRGRRSSAFRAER